MRLGLSTQDQKTRTGLHGLQVNAEAHGKGLDRHPPVTLTKLLKSPSGMMLGSELPGISKLRPPRQRRGAGGQAPEPRNPPRVLEAGAGTLT